VGWVIIHWFELGTLAHIPHSDGRPSAMAKHDPAPFLQRLLCRISRVPRSCEPGEAGLHY
jgi:hypothetical protein